MGRAAGQQALHYIIQSHKTSTVLTKDTEDCLKEEREWFIDKTDIIKADLLNDELFGQNHLQSVDVQFSLNTLKKT